MMKKSIAIGNQGYEIDCPDKCPICHHHSEIHLFKADETFNKTEVQVVFQCVYSGCKSYFIGYYGPKGQAELKTLKPIKPNPTAFPEDISRLSPTFISVFREAEEALHQGLPQVAGPGYRKAFEFLIKDYAKSLAPEKHEEIEKAFSGSVVSEYVTDPRIQAVAKRTLWLGNDETHYLRKWTTHDMDDLIRLIRLAVNWIEIDQLSKHYNESMPD
ncbi:DUF4145 domain-containing protein [Methylophilus sp. VKM B-3414]|uniref:DUF4145 domain-containing protein n=1 Tax=Methylophilus sp. VKM B-3414 TaxID=3076121 RepID=UPI0028C562F6|nr:DUF4145 domain-containing protein [Methylophilus sp. VKM B-3414]MDT7850162.1 DUF4145 domain-containing protein [Methylophilus sp. VKM B-3414]